MAGLGLPGRTFFGIAGLGAQCLARPRGELLDFRALGLERRARLHPGDPRGNEMGRRSLYLVTWLSKQPRRTPRRCFSSVLPPSLVSRSNKFRFLACCAAAEGLRAGSLGSERRCDSCANLRCPEGGGLCCDAEGGVPLTPGLAGRSRSCPGSSVPVPLPSARGPGRSGARRDLARHEGMWPQ